MASNRPSFQIVTHLAFYAGWANAMSAVMIANGIFHQRGIGVDQLPPAKEKLLSLNEEVEKQRATQVSSNFGAVSSGKHNRSSLPRSLAAACPGAERPQSRDRERSNRKRKDWANHLSPRSCHG